MTNSLYHNHIHHRDGISITYRRFRAWTIARAMQSNNARAKQCSNARAMARAVQPSHARVMARAV